MALTTVTNIGPIDLTSLSFEDVLSDLQTWAKGKPDGDTWQDWQTSSNGTIVSEWVAGLATFRAYYELMRVRESQLDQAQLDSSVWNLAFNKGLLVPPSQGAQMQLTVIVPAQKSVDVGDFIATVGQYELYSLESKTIQAATSTTLLCAVGRLVTTAQTVAGLNTFQTFKFYFSDVYFSTDLESFTVDGVPVPLLSDPDYLNDTHDDFILRRTMPSQVRVYVGNGVIGWYKPTASNVTYTALTYSSDITAALTGLPSLVIAGTLAGSTVLLQPSFDPDREQVRDIARYYPIDGRIVTASDYSVIIRKNFGGLLDDCYSFNTDPDQQVHLLVNSSFGTGSAAANYQTKIQTLVDSKRALGMNVIYTVHQESEGLTFVANLKCAVADYSNDLVTAANKYLATQTFVFQREPVTLTTTDLAIELSAKYGVKFFPVDEATITLSATQFFGSLSITLVGGVVPA